MSNTKQINDFGAKIGGAKKDLWKERGLLSSDIGNMNDREAEKFVKKDYIWKKNDYQAMIDGGIPFDVVYYIKKVRDSIAAAPVYLRKDDTSEKRLARQKQYVDTVREIQSAMESLTSKDGALAAFTRIFEENGYFKEKSGALGGYRYEATEKLKDNPAVTSKLVGAFCVSEHTFEFKITREAIRKQFGAPKDQKIPQGYEVQFHDGKNSFSKNNDWEPNTFFVAKNHMILKSNFKTKEAAIEWAREYTSSRKQGTKKKFVPKQLSHIQRDGIDFRQGRDVEGQDYLDAFGFRGGEFGNWMSDNDRQASLNYGYDALKDLAFALSVADENISLHNSLSIAFGARGSGSAVAHYEPMRQVINLTKMRGAGSLAHEWWHALDDFLGQKEGANGLLSENPHKNPLFKKLIKTIKSKPESLEQATERERTQKDGIKQSAERSVDSIVLPSIKRNGDEAALAEYAKYKSAYLDGATGSVKKMNALKKTVTGRMIPKDERERLEIYEKILCGFSQKTDVSIGEVYTDYYKNSKQMGGNYHKDGGYWDSNTELTARAFATYVMDKLACKSDYLVGHAECAVSMTADKAGEPQIIRAYPMGDERIAINAVFDEIFEDLKVSGYLTKTENHISGGVHEVAKAI